MEKPLRLLNNDEINMFIGLFEKIRKIDSMRVTTRFIAHENTYRISIHMLHPEEEEYEPLLGYIYGETVSEMVDALGKFKIPKIVAKTEDLTQENIIEFFKVLEARAPVVEYCVIPCPVCSDPTNFILACGHALCPHCSYRVSCCTLCREELEEDFWPDDE